VAWLSEQPVIERVPGPCRRGYSRRDGPDLRTDAATAAADAALSEILLPGKATLASRRKITDIQHLTAHYMAGHDAFVTSDQGGLLQAHGGPGADRDRRSRSDRGRGHGTRPGPLNGILTTIGVITAGCLSSLP
jgi:hypothetical protein